MRRQLYIDGFENVHFINGMIRIDTFSISPSKDGQTTTEPTDRILMSPQVFIESLNAMQQLAEKLTEAGILKKG